MLVERQSKITVLPKPVRLDDVNRDTKGTVIAAIRAYAQQRFAGDGWTRVLASLTPEEAEVARAAVPIGWYSTALTMRVLEGLRASFETEAPDLLPGYGRFAAESDLTVFHRLFLRMANPAFVIEKVSDYWRRFHTHGRWSVERLGPNGMVAKLHDFEGSRVYCDALVPYVQRMLELVGAKSVRSAHPECVHRGAAACVFSANWR